MRKRVLMVAFHFPPLAGTSGTQRTVGFARYLPDFGWDPIVLTVRPFVYEQTDPSQLASLTALEVHRAWAFDSSRHFAVADKYPAFLARPDRWISWWPAAVFEGKRAIRRAHAAALWSTYPIATAHLIARTLHRATRLPWIADFRDPMAQDGYPADPRTWRSFKRIEEQTIAEADRSVFTTAGAAQEYRDRYAQRGDTIGVIENGFDEEAFAGLQPAYDAREKRRVLLHSGIVYPSERNPAQFFAALRSLCDAGRLRPEDLIVRFRAPTHDAFLRELAEKFGVSAFIEIAPPLPYRDALREMMGADGLLILQAANCNQQIPAKLYEYLRAGRPILGLADPIGDTAGALRAAGVAHIAALEDRDAVAAALTAFLEGLASGNHVAPSVASASRRERARSLAALLDETVDAKSRVRAAAR